eukprot:scaffold3768_cov376-Prasinococcus_capsulatus_cf.AAC.18
MLRNSRPSCSTRRAYSLGRSTSTCSSSMNLNSSDRLSFRSSVLKSAATRGPREDGRRRQRAAQHGALRVSRGRTNEFALGEQLAHALLLEAGQLRALSLLHDDMRVRGRANAQAARSAQDAATCDARSGAHAAAYHGAVGAAKHDILPLHGRRRRRRGALLPLAAGAGGVQLVVRRRRREGRRGHGCAAANSPRRRVAARKAQAASCGAPAAGKPLARATLCAAGLRGARHK